MVLSLCCFFSWPQIFLLVKSETMASIIMDTNQGTPVQGDSYAFLLFGNIGVPLMATLNLPGFTLGLSVFFF